MRTEIIALTPEVAASLATKIPEYQRSVSANVVTRYASAMKRGEWKLNGEPIILSAAGEVLDGQHRVRAVLASGVTIPALIVHVDAGQEQALFATMGIGRARKGSDYLHFLGYKNTTTLFAAASLCLKLESGQEPEWGKRATVSNLMVEQYIQRHPRLADRAANIQNSKKFTGRKAYLAPSILCALWQLTSEVDEALSDWFFERLYTGEELLATDPVYALRGRIQVSWQTGRVVGYAELIAITIKAWNGTRQHKPMRALRYNAPEIFPTIL